MKYTRGVWKVLSIRKTKLPGYHTDWIPSEGPHCDWTALFWTTEASKGSNQRKKAKEAHKRNSLPPRHCTSSHFRGCHGNNSRLRIWTCPHPPYSPDLTPSDFHLFPQIKKALAGCHFASDDIIIAIEEFFESQTKELFYTGFKALQHRWSKCSALEGDYVEK